MNHKIEEGIRLINDRRFWDAGVALSAACQEGFETEDTIQLAETLLQIPIQEIIREDNQDLKAGFIAIAEGTLRSLMEDAAYTRQQYLAPFKSGRPALSQQANTDDSALRLHKGIDKVSDKLGEMLSRIGKSSNKISEKACIDANLHVESRTVLVKTEVEEPYQIEETYNEKVIIRPKRWFFPAITKMDTKTRMVNSVRRSLRESKKETLVLVDNAGNMHGSPIEFIKVAAGKFVMGSPSNEEDLWGNEKQHEVVLTKEFELMATPVTQALWVAIMGDNPTPARFRGPKQPVEKVSWDKAQQFIEKLNTILRSGSRYRLPNEAEWEYACRAGSMATRYGRLEDIAWYANNSGDAIHEVGKKQPNAWGFYDMLGNIQEWCQDGLWDYPTGPVTDPIESPRGNKRVIRGGSAHLRGDKIRAAYRDEGDKTFGYDFQGFRLARSS
jgi:formylglycine-generating enzyme required for sulfatase activity